ncbi:MAG: DUF4317 family protein [Pseudobutyrivibrio ruminis]|uniref:DUF4317 family protein n=1 Tax=Pseudobutyrivibrio ruminis TaxID=46206 RepID=UPI0026EBC893|nr:DUF4317 family protein [Pseudobutyrivibrio ruminis]MBE5914740.1 DUF4317 family protein [Pseudobutyrivibrio ruminis]
MGQINRDDMLELTRRMTSARSNLVRIAGAYIDEEGYIDGTFNTSFLSLKGEEKRRCLEIAKAIPFAKPNEELISYKIPGLGPGSIWQMIYALKDCGLQNDALMLNLYELIAEKYPKGRPYAIYMYYGAYDVPIKGSDKAYQDESEEVYQYLILAISPVDEEQVPHSPETGFLYPAFTNRSTDVAHVNFYSKDYEEAQELMEFLNIKA